MNEVLAGVAAGAALLTALVNMAGIFWRAKVDPGALAVIQDMARQSTKVSQDQADKIDKLTTSIIGELSKNALLLGTVSGKIDRMSKVR